MDKGQSRMVGAAGWGLAVSVLNKSQRVDPKIPGSFKKGIAQSIGMPSNAIAACAGVIGLKLFMEDSIPPEYRDTFDGAVDAAVGFGSLYYGEQALGFGVAEFATKATAAGASATSVDVGGDWYGYDAAAATEDYGYEVDAAPDPGGSDAGLVGVDLADAFHSEAA